MRAVEANRAAPAPAADGGRGAPRAPGDPLDVVLEHLRDVVRADAAIVVAIDRDADVVEPTAWWFASSELREAVMPALHRPYDRRRPGLVEAAIERGRPLLLPRLEDWEAADHPRAHVSAAREEAWELVRAASAISCPVRTPLGRTLGALVALTLDPRRALTKADLDVVTVLADLAALARERSEMLLAEAGRAREELLLKRAAAGTSATLEPEAVEQRIVEHALEIAGADHCRLDRVRPGSRRLVTAASAGAEIPVETATVSEVVRTREAVTHGAGRPPSIHMPIVLGPRLFGVVSLARATDRQFGRDDVALVAKVARIAAAALANAHAYEQERHLARTLTHGFVPASLPEIAGWDLGLLYEPADHQPTGGDLYGAWELADGEVALLIGDVAGKGIESAALSAMARFFVEARSWDCDDPAEILRQASAMLCGRLPRERFVTCFLGLLGRRRLRYANAGHIAPLVVHADDRVTATATGALPLGIEERPDYRCHELELARDDVVVAFTDGVVEARREGRLLGEEGLRRLLLDATAATREPQTLAELVHDGVRGWASGLDDDAAIVVARRRGLAVAPIAGR